MSDILSPEELADYTTDKRIHATIDALAEALVEAVASMEECPDPEHCDCSTAEWSRGRNRRRIAAWLEGKT